MVGAPPYALPQVGVCGIAGFADSIRLGLDLTPCLGSRKGVLKVLRVETRGGGIFDDDLFCEPSPIRGAAPGFTGDKGLRMDEMEEECDILLSNDVLCVGAQMNEMSVADELCDKIEDDELPRIFGLVDSSACFCVSTPPFFAFSSCSLFCCLRSFSLLFPLVLLILFSFPCLFGLSSGCGLSSVSLFIGEACRRNCSSKRSSCVLADADPDMSPMLASEERTLLDPAKECEAEDEGNALRRQGGSERWFRQNRLRGRTGSLTFVDE